MARRKDGTRSGSRVMMSELMRPVHPVDAVEAMADERSWAHSRSSDDEIAVMAHGTWTDYSISFSWIENVECLHVICAFDMRIPEKNLVETMRLIGLANGQLLMGHFELWEQDGSVLFRHTLPLSGGAELAEAQIETMHSAVFTGCERYYQAFQHVVWAGQSADDALENVLFDTVGEA